MKWRKGDIYRTMNNNQYFLPTPLSILSATPPLETIVSQDRVHNSLAWHSRFSPNRVLSLLSLLYTILSQELIDWLIDWLLIPYCLQSTFLGNRFWEGDLHVESLSKGEESWIGQKMEEMQLQQRVLELGWPFRVAPPWGKGVRSHLTFPSSVQH